MCAKRDINTLQLLKISKTSQEVLSKQIFFLSNPHSSIENSLLIISNFGIIFSTAITSIKARTSLGFQYVRSDVLNSLFLPPWHGVFRHFVYFIEIISYWCRYVLCSWVVIALAWEADSFSFCKPPLLLCGLLPSDFLICRCTTMLTKPTQMFAPSNV